MKQVFAIIILLAFSNRVFAQNEVGPEGGKLLWLVVLLVAAILVAVWILKPGKTAKGFKKFIFNKTKVTVELKKDRLYHPRFLELTVTNTGNSDVDLDTPLLVFSGFWLSRKFKLKGTNNAQLYPLFLMKGQSHTLNIELDRFYGFDKNLKRLPWAKVMVKGVNGKQLGSQRVILRKTLFTF